MAQHKKETIKPKASSHEKSQSSCILLVEDEPTHVAVMSHTIRSANPNTVVKVAGSLKEYRSVIAKCLPEIALIDVHLPDGKALEVLTSPPEDGSFPIVVMTSSGDEKIAVKAMKAGALDYVVKSTESFKAMPHTIERALHEWKMIQDRKRAEEALRESEFQFRSLYENVAVGLYRTTPSGKILLANRAMVEMLGFSSFEELAKRNLVKAGFARSYQRKEFLWKVEAEGEINDFESAWLRQDGSLVIVRESARAIRDSQGKTLYYDGVVEDVTEHRLAESASKYAEDALRESEEKFRNLFENAVAGIYHTSLDGRCINVNMAYAKMLGYESPEEAIMTVTDIAHQLYANPDDRKIAIGILNEKGILKNFETQLRKKDGSIIWVSINSRLNKSMQGESRFEGFITDITERKRAEEVLRESEQWPSSIYDTVDDVIFYLAVESEGKYRFISVNNAFCNVTGLSQEQVVGKMVNEVIPEPSLSLVLGKYKQAIEENSIVRWEETSDYPMGRLTGDVSIAPVVDEKGHCTHLVGAVHDITDRKRAETELAKTRILLEQTFEQSPIPMVLVSMPDAIVRIINPACREFLGVMDEPSYIGTSLMNYKPSYMDYDVQGNLGEVKDLPLAHALAGHKTSNEERFIVRKDGTARWELVNANPIYNNRREIIAGYLTMNDITDRKRSEVLLKQSETRYRLLADHMKDTVWVMDIDLKTTYISPSVEKLRGYTLKEIQQLPLDQQLAPASFQLAMDAFSEEMQKVMMDPTYFISRTLELEFYRKDRTTYWSENKFSLIRDDNGSPISIMGEGRDITDRKRVEEELQKSEERLSNFMDSASDIFYLLDAKLNFVEINKRGLEIIGKPREDVIGKNIAEIVPDVKTSGRFEKHLEVLKTGIPFVVENFVPHPVFGNLHFILKSFKAGDCLGVIASDITDRKRAEEALLRDISERKQTEQALQKSEEKYRSIVEQTIVGIGISKGSQIIFANNALLRIHNYDDLEEFKKLPLLDHIAPSSRKFISDRMKIVAEGKSPPPEFEYDILCRNGQIKTLRAFSSHVSSGGEVYTHSIFQDITESKRTEDALRQMQKLEGLGTLAGGIAHDFNNILGIILAYNSSIERSKGDAKKVDFATETITKAVQRGKTLVQQILTFARKTETSFGVVNVNDVIMEIMTMILETFPKVLTYSQNFDKAIPFIKADRSQLNQALLNLCVNARDAMPKGGVLTINTRMVSGISLRTQHPDAAESRYVCIEVSDTGEGMIEETRKRIFEPFFTTKGIGKGTGLGLSMVFGVVQTHKGFIDVQSELGKGTTFRLYFPVSQAIEPIIEKEEETLEEIPGGTETLLVVEDEEMLMMSLQMVLVEKGYNVLSAGDGLEALKIYQERKDDIALVLTDLGLPTITGLEVCQRIRKIKSNEHMILATGYLDPEMKSEFLKAGIQHFLYKPYDLKKVLKVVREVIDEK